MSVSLLAGLVRLDRKWKLLQRTAMARRLFWQCHEARNSEFLNGADSCPARRPGTGTTVVAALDATVGRAVDALVALRQYWRLLGYRPY